MRSGLIPHVTFCDISKCGATGVDTQRWSRDDLRKFENEYLKKFCISGKAVLTYCPLYFLARKIFSERSFVNSPSAPCPRKGVGNEAAWVCGRILLKRREKESS